MEIPEIDYDARQAPYKQIAAWLAGQIDSGLIQPGKKVPSETDLVQTFGVSRGTARRAVKLLRDQGVVVTEPGRGSYAATR